jgi:hypothetical protein
VPHYRTPSAGVDRSLGPLGPGVSRFFPYYSFCSTEGSSPETRFDPLLALGVSLAPVRH